MLDELAAAIDGLDAAELADGDALVELHRLRARLEAVEASAVAAWDAQRAWADDGARSAAAWLTARTRVPEATARRCVRLGRALRSLPCAEAAWRAGDIDAAHVSALAAARTDRRSEAMARDEAMLVEHARTMRFSQFQRALAYWSQLADPDGADDEGQRLVDERRLDVSSTFRGAVVGDFLLDPIGGTIVRDTIEGIERELFEAEWAEAKERLGRDPLVTDLARTPKQRRADALVEMAVRSRTTQGRRPAPLFTVFVGFETFAGRICELANGTVVAPGALVPHLDEAYVERVVFDSPSRVLDVGEQGRFFTGATRRAVEARDRECFHDLCEERGARLEVDHVVPAAVGGPTRQDNARLACGFHNRRRPRAQPP